MEIQIGRTYTFEAAHQLPSHLGKCKWLHGHGYKLEVVIKMALGHTISCQSSSPECGMIMDFGKLDEIMNVVLADFDHTNLNLTMQNPTAENIVKSLSNRISQRLPPHVKVSKIKLWETDRAYAEVVED